MFTELINETNKVLQEYFNPMADQGTCLPYNKCPRKMSSFLDFFVIKLN